MRVAGGTGVEGAGEWKCLVVSATGGAIVCSSVEVDGAEGACVVWLPEPLSLPARILCSEVCVWCSVGGDDSCQGVAQSVFGPELCESPGFVGLYHMCRRF